MYRVLQFEGGGVSGCAGLLCRLVVEYCTSTIYCNVETGLGPGGLRLILRASGSPRSQLFQDPERHVCTYICMSVCMDAWMCLCMCVYMHALMYVWMHGL